MENLSEDEYLEDDGDVEGDPITAKQVLTTLLNTWMNERFSPEILPHQSDMLDLMLGQIVHIEENLKQLNKNDFRLIAHKMELERIKYIISSYLRCRLRKIEKYTTDILAEENKRSEKRLSKEEYEFAVNFKNSIKTHFHQIALRNMPLNLQEPSAKETIKSNLMSHVFLKANVSVASVVIGKNDEEVDLLAGSRHIMPYHLAAELILDGRVQLI